MEKVSVILPIYNGEKYIDECLESLINQTYKNIEIVIIDDGSTDATAVKIQKYLNDKRVKFFSRENKGLVYTLNELINISSGEFIARMDIDDICALNRIEEQLNYIIEENVDVVGTKVKVFNEENILNGYTDAVYNVNFKENIKEHIFKDGGFICHPTIMFRKSSILKVKGYSEVCYTVEDLELYLRGNENGLKFRKMNKILLSYRVGNNSKSEREFGVDDNLKSVIRLKINYIKKDVKKFENIVVWGKGRGGRLIEEVLKEEGKRVSFVESTMSDLKERLSDDVDCILIGSAVGKFEIKEKILNEFDFFKGKYFMVI